MKKNKLVCQDRKIFSELSNRQVLDRESMLTIMMSLAVGFVSALGLTLLVLLLNDIS